MAVTRRRVKQAGLLYAIKLFHDLAGRHGEARSVHFVGQETQNTRGEHAAEQVHGDLLVGPAKHRVHRNVVVLLLLAKAGLHLSLGVIGGDDLNCRPVVSVGDEHTLAEDLLLERGSLVGVNIEVEDQVLRGRGRRRDSHHPLHSVRRADLLELGPDDFSPPTAATAGATPGQIVQRGPSPPRIRDRPGGKIRRDGLQYRVDGRATEFANSIELSSTTSAQQLPRTVVNPGVFRRCVMRDELGHLQVFGRNLLVFQGVRLTP